MRRVEENQKYSYVPNYSSLNTPDFFFKKFLVIYSNLNIILGLRVVEILDCRKGY